MEVAASQDEVLTGLRGDIYDIMGDGEFSVSAVLQMMDLKDRPEIVIRALSQLHHHGLVSRRRSMKTRSVYYKRADIQTNPLAGES